MMLLTSVAYYRCGKIVQAKIYVPSYCIDVGNRKSRRVRLIYRGLEFDVSASPPNNGRGLKVYIPASILANLIDHKPNKALVEISWEDDYGIIEIISFGWRCRICGELTLEDDELCWSHRVQGGGVCRRCGMPISSGELCRSCCSRIYRAYLAYEL